MRRSPSARVGEVCVPRCAQANRLKNTKKSRKDLGAKATPQLARVPDLKEGLNPSDLIHMGGVTAVVYTVVWRNSVV